MSIQGYGTILVFFFAELISFVIYVINMTSYSQILGGHLGPISDIILQQVLNGMLFYYAYQVKVVQIKLESEDYKTYKNRLKKAKCQWLFYATLLFFIVVIQIIEKVYLNNITQN
jgi:uncharacterized membrane protein